MRLLLLLLGLAACWAVMLAAEAGAFHVFDNNSSQNNATHLCNPEAAEWEIGQDWSRQLEQHIAGLDQILESFIENLPPWVVSVLVHEPLCHTKSRSFICLLTAVCLTLIAIKIVCFSGSGLPKRDHKFESLVSMAERLYYETKEKEILEYEVEKLEAQLKSSDSKSTVSNAEVEELKLKVLTLEHTVECQKVELDKLSDENSKQADTINTLTKEHESQKVELDKLSEENSKQAETINTLTKEHDHTISSMKQELAERYSLISEQTETTERQLAETEDLLRTSAVAMQDQLQTMAEEVSTLQEARAQLVLEAEEANNKIEELTAHLKVSDDLDHRYATELKNKDKEIEVLKYCIKTLESGESNLDGDSKTDELKSAGDNEEEHNQSKQKKLLNVAQISTELQQAQRDKNDANTKLNVLAHYFKEREVELQKELAEMSFNKTQVIKELESVTERNKTMEERIAIYRIQVEDLKREIELSDALEKKVNEARRATRRAESDIKVYKEEAKRLRHMLLASEMRHSPQPDLNTRPLLMHPAGMGRTAPHPFDQCTPVDMRTPPFWPTLMHPFYRHGPPPPHMMRRGPPPPGPSRRPSDASPSPTGSPRAPPQAAVLTDCQVQDPTTSSPSDNSFV